MDRELERDRLLDILRQPDTALAQYLVQHHAFWQEPGNANRIDEIQEHFEGMTPENFRREATPPALLARLARERAASRTEQLSDDPFPCLKLIDPCVYEEGDFTVEVIRTSRQLSRASCELKNCAGGYLRVARAGHTVLLVLKQAGKLVGMAECAEGKFMQVVEHSNKPLRAEWREIFDRAERFLPKRLVIVCSDQHQGTGKGVEQMVSKAHQGVSRCINCVLLYSACFCQKKLIKYIFGPAGPEFRTS